MGYQPAYRTPYRRRRRRRRNSHYGVLIALILVVLIAIPVLFKVVTTIGSAVFSGSGNEVVFQTYNTNAYAEGKLVELGTASPFLDDSGNALVPLGALECLDMKTEWEQVSNTALVEHKKDQIRMSVGSTTMRIGEETRTMSAAPSIVDGTTYVPISDICAALSWQYGRIEPAEGDLIVVSKSKKALDEKKLDKAAAQALEKLGPSRAQLMSGCLLMRTDSDKLLTDGTLQQMTEPEKKSGTPVLDRDGVKYVPLQGAVNALGGTAEVDEKGNWTITCREQESTISHKGKAKVNGKTQKGDGLSTLTEEESGRFYVSAPLFAGLIGAHYTDLADENGTFAFTGMPLDGFDSQKAYLDTLKDELTAAVVTNVPEADAYVALTFDDGPTGALDDYPNGLTSYLLDGLKERGAHATFFMCGYRINDFNSHMQRYLAEGSELGNHTMDHPDCKLTGLDAEGVNKQVASNSELIESYTGHKPTVMRPVGGGVNDTVKEQMKQLGLPIINWSVDTQDWRVRDAASVKSAIVDKVKDGDIVLMHDLYPSTVEGVLAAIDELQAGTDKTYAFVTVSELAAAKGVTLEPGVVYNDLSDATVQSIMEGSYAPAEFT